MKEVTLSQVSQVIHLMRQKKMTHQRFEELISSGLLADLLDRSIHPSEIRRDQFRQIIGFGAIVQTFTTEVDYDLPLQQGVLKAGLSFLGLGVWQGNGWAEELQCIFNAPHGLGDQASGIVKLDLRVVSFGDIGDRGFWPAYSREHINQAMAELDMRTAIAPELIASAIAHHSALSQYEDPLTALGSSYSFGGEDQVLAIDWSRIPPLLHQISGKRFVGNTRFLAVKI